VNTHSVYVRNLQSHAGKLPFKAPSTQDAVESDASTVFRHPLSIISRLTLYSKLKFVSS